MAGLALIRAVDVVNTFATGSGAVMTGHTSATDLGMIHRAWRYWNPGRGAAVAGIAHIGGADMGGTFTRCSAAIVTTDACTNDFHVINLRRGHRCPGGGIAVAGLAVVTAVNV